jgi:hypothetical protein
MTVVMSLLGGSILVSICFLFTGSTRDIAATAFGLLLGIRIGTLTVSVSNCYKIPFLGSGGMLLGVATFLLVRGYLSSGRGVSPDAIFRNIKDFANMFMDFGARLTNVVLLVLHLKDDSSLRIATHPSRGTPRRVVFRRILTPALIIAFTLFVLVGVLEFLRGSVFRSVPWWLRELGIVEQMQGQAFLVVFISILLTLAVLTYCVLSIAEALSGPQD